MVFVCVEQPFCFSTVYPAFAMIVLFHIISRQAYVHVFMAILNVPLQMQSHTKVFIT